MKKSDLKTGMIVITRDGNQFVVFIDVVDTCKGGDLHSVIVNDEDWLSLKNYDENLIYKNDALPEFDIIEIYAPSNLFGFMNIEYEKDERKLLWKREDNIKEVTIRDIEDKFGCKVKIVSE